MQATEIINTIFRVVIIPLLGILTAYAVQWLQAKSQQLEVTTNDLLVRKYIALLNDIICDAVIAVNQTYVESLKAQGKFDSTAQKEAFNKAYTTVIAMLSDEVKEILEEALGDLQIYITNKIEMEVNANKKQG